MENNDSQQPPPPPQPPSLPLQPPTTTPPPPPPPFPYTHLLHQQHQHQLQSFWSVQRHEIEHVNDFKNHQLPLARIKKIMKADEDVRMISAEAPILFAKACELFILELTIRSWLHAEENKRRTLQKNDIAAAITRTDIFDFLIDIVPREEPRDEGANAPAAGGGGIVGAIVGPGAVANGVPYYYQSDPAAGVVIGRPGLDPMAGVYPPVSAAWQSVWQSGPPPPPPDEGNSSQGNID